MIPVRRFDCGRSCARWHACRFAPVLGASYRVHSHTVRVAVAVKDLDAFAAVALAMGGEVLGPGTFPLFESTETGFGVKLPGWAYPIVATAAGTIAADHYEGAWGNPADLVALAEGYAIEAARRAADLQGWYHETQSDGALLIYHPEGGTLTVSPSGTVDAAGFTGCGCDQAAGPIAEALGRTVDRVNKPEYLQERAHVRATE